jgi:hypothetical protein
MNIAKVLVAGVLLASAGIGAGKAQVGATPPVDQLHRTVARDAETRIIWAALWRRNPNNVCTARFIPQLELVAAPAHGIVRFMTTSRIPTKSGCGNTVYGTALMYRPNPGFVGRDQFTYYLPPEPMTTDWTRGGPGTRIVTIEVR